MDIEMQLKKYIEKKCMQNHDQNISEKNMAGEQWVPFHKFQIVPT